MDVLCVGALPMRVISLQGQRQLQAFHASFDAEFLLTLFVIGDLTRGLLGAENLVVVIKFVRLSHGQAFQRFLSSRAPAILLARRSIELLPNSESQLIYASSKF